MHRWIGWGLLGLLVVGSVTLVVGFRETETPSEGPLRVDLAVDAAAFRGARTADLVLGRVADDGLHTVARTWSVDPGALEGSWRFEEAWPASEPSPNRLLILADGHPARMIALERKGARIAVSVGPSPVGSGGEAREQRIDVVDGVGTPVGDLVLAVATDIEPPRSLRDAFRVMATDPSSVIAFVHVDEAGRGMLHAWPAARFQAMVRTPGWLPLDRMTDDRRLPDTRHPGRAPPPVSYDVGERTRLALGRVFVAEVRTERLATGTWPAVRSLNAGAASGRYGEEAPRIDGWLGEVHLKLAVDRSRSPDTSSTDRITAPVAHWLARDSRQPVGALPQTPVLVHAPGYTPEEINATWRPVDARRVPSGGPATSLQPRTTRMGTMSIGLRPEKGAQPLPPGFRLSVTVREAGAGTEGAVGMRAITGASGDLVVDDPLPFGSYRLKASGLRSRVPGTAALGSAEVQVSVGAVPSPAHLTTPTWTAMELRVLDDVTGQPVKAVRFRNLRRGEQGLGSPQTVLYSRVMGPRGGALIGGHHPVARRIDEGQHTYLYTRRWDPEVSFVLLAPGYAPAPVTVELEAHTITQKTIRLVRTP